MANKKKVKKEHRKATRVARGKDKLRRKLAKREGSIEQHIDTTNERSKNTQGEGVPMEKKGSREDVNQAAARIVREATD